MPQHTRSWIGREHPLEPFCHLVAAVGEYDHARVDRVADPNAPAVVDAYPRRPGGNVEQRVQDRPVRDRIGPISHRLGLAKRRGHRARVEMVAADYDRRLDASRPDELVDRESRPSTIAVAEPADPGRQALAGDSSG